MLRRCWRRMPLRRAAHRRAIRFTWHMATLLMLLTALTIAWPGTPVPVVMLIGAAYLGLGLLAFYISKGRHISGPMFAAAGCSPSYTMIGQAAVPSC